MEATHDGGAAVEVRMVPIASITMDRRLQQRLKWPDDDHVLSLAERQAAGEKLPRPTLFHDGEAYWPADGWHTIASQAFLDRTEIECSVRQGSWRDAWLYSLTANSSHGLLFSADDKRAIVNRALDDSELNVLSTNLLATRLRVSPSLVKRLREERSCARTSEPERVQGADGKSYPATRPRGKIGQFLSGEPLEPEPPEPPKELVDDVLQKNLAGWSDPRRAAERTFRKEHHGLANKVRAGKDPAAIQGFDLFLDRFRHETNRPDATEEDLMQAMRESDPKPTRKAAREEAAKLPPPPFDYRRVTDAAGALVRLLDEMGERTGTQNGPQHERCRDDLSVFIRHFDEWRKSLRF